MTAVSHVFCFRDITPRLHIRLKGGVIPSSSLIPTISVPLLDYTLNLFNHSFLTYLNSFSLNFIFWTCPVFFSSRGWCTWWPRRHGGLQTCLAPWFSSVSYTRPRKSRTSLFRPAFLTGFWKPFRTNWLVSYCKQQLTQSPIIVDL